MIYKILSFFKIFVFWVVVFLMQKPIFMIRYYHLIGNCKATDWLAVMWHGLPLDLSMAAYLTVIPALLLIAGLYMHNVYVRYIYNVNKATLPSGSWIGLVWINRIYKTYNLIAAILVSTAFIINLALYDFWGFPLDSTPLFYFLSSPKDALASVSIWFVSFGILAIAVCVYIITRCVNRLFPAINYQTTFAARQLSINNYSFIPLLFLTAALFIPIRGGFTVSTMNTGKVYFSGNQRLNHAAINPLFSFMESVFNTKDPASQYRFMDEKEAEKLFNTLINTKSDSTEILLNTSRPDVLIIVLESFSDKIMATFGSEKNITVNLDRIASEGILFKNFYANSFRTDRGLVSILSGYPAQPTMSIMQHPRKTADLPSICRSLVNNGYTANYYYGGDADFTNMRSYLVSSGFGSIVADVNFPVSERLSKWGVHDEFVFNRLLNDLRHQKAGKKMFRVLQTSSSHEPFDVPYHRLNNKIFNAFAYTDYCLGKFIDEFKKLPQWRNTLVILVPDHLGAYPQGISNFVLDRYRIPLIFTGGAISGHRVVNTIGSQHDIAATLLGQMGIQHTDFTFSKDLLSPISPHFAFFAVPDAFGMVTDSTAVIYNNTARRVVLGTGKGQQHALKLGEAYLQKLYDDMAKR